MIILKHIREYVMTMLKHMTTQEAIENFLIHVNKIVAGYHFREFGNTDAPRVIVEHLSSKWSRLVLQKLEMGFGIDNKVYKTISTYGFICMSVFESKTQGITNLGDIYKAASEKAPAKKSRGSIFDTLSWTCVHPKAISFCVDFGRSSDAYRRC